MLNTRDFRRRIKFGFALVVFLAGAVAFFSLFSLRSVIESKDLVISNYARDVVQTRDLVLASDQVASSSRAYMLTGDPRYLRQAENARDLYRTRIDLLRTSVVVPEENQLLDAALSAAVAHQEALDAAISAETKGVDPRDIADLFEAIVQPRSKALREALNRLVLEKDNRAKAALDRSQREARRATVFVATLGGTAAFVAGGLFLLCARTLRRLELTEAEVQLLNETLEQRVRERTREIEGFAYSIAHDLRGPLRAIAGLGELVMTDCEKTLDAPGRDALTRMRNAAIRMDELINGLLGLARFSYQEFPLASLDVSEVIHDSLAALDHEIDARKATIDVDVAPLRVWAHPFLASLALSQFISNSLKFVAPGVAPRLRLRTERRGDRIRLCVTDNGIGIPPEYHARIFGMFQRLHPIDAYPGVGVGLTLAQRAAERMGGAVGVDSAPGSGSVFWIELAAADAGNEAPSAALLAEAQRA